MADLGGLLLLSAPTRAGLIGRLAAAREGAAPPPSPIEPQRLALVADDARGMAEAIDFAAARLQQDDQKRFNAANRVFYAATGGEKPSPTALMFPGFGARHPTLLSDLIGGFPSMRDWFAGLPDAVRARLASNPLLFPAETSEPPGFAHAIEAALTGSLALYALLDRLCPGLHRDALVGHSYGETAVLLAAGMVADPTPVFDLLFRVWDGIRRNPPAAPVEMLAVSLGAEHLASILADHAVMLALDNCPHQKMLCGPRPAMAELAGTLRQRGIPHFLVPDLTVPVHTRRFPVPQHELAGIYAALSPAPPRWPTYACATAARLPDSPAAVRQVLCEHWFRPVRFTETIARLHADGIRTFLEVGPGGHLTGFVRDILRGRDATAIATNLESRGTIAQLRTCLAQLFVRGHGVDPHALQPMPGPPPAAPARPAERVQGAVLVDELTRLVAEIAELDSPELIDPQRGFFDLGLDSLRALRLIERLQALLGRPLSPTLTFDYPTIAALATHLAGPAEAPRRPTAAAPQQDGEVAVIGIACRFPGGADSPATYWHLLHRAGDAITDLPDGRWDLDEIRAAGVDPAAMPHIFRAGFLDEIRDFDCDFFGISRREALTLDPQQRLLLELSREALEDAAIPPSRLRASPTGVFVGISNADYAQRLSMRERIAIGGYLGTGNTASTAAGRLSFVLGLQGPSLAVDTACSSSLVAVHLACRSLRQGESRLALAGGVNLLVSPETSIFLARAGALSPDGRCKTFDAGADGYVRGEGGAVVVLKRLVDAVADGDRVLAVIRGSAVNHDGRTSGFTVPNGPAQQAVIRAALADAGLSPDDVDCVEAHGTGTALGDPIEVAALGAVFGPRGRPERLLIGSAKTNLGHLEAAAGLASLIKVVLQLQRGEIPASRNLSTPSRHIAWERLPLAVADRARPWRRRDRPRVAGVSSFGISGTNAHVILAEAPPAAAPERLPRARQVLTLSARSPAALDRLAGAMTERLAAAGEDFADLCATANLGRDHLPHRLCVTAADAAEATASLARARPGMAARAPKLAFLFSGQGSQLPGMGRGLFAAEPVFRAAVEECERRLRPHLGPPVTELLFGPAGGLDATVHTQPALFTLQYALVLLWRSWGVQPDLVLGHSIGEYAAACAAGMFDLDDALRLVAARGRLIQALPAGGAMAAIGLGEAAADALLRRHDLPLSIAAVNGAASVVLSGPAESVARAESLLRAAAVRTTRLPVSHAFHSQLMEPALAEFRRLAETVACRAPTLPLVCNVTGGLLQGAPTAAYWTDQLRRTVRFADGIRTLLAQGCTAFLEIGPRPVLIALAQADHRAGLWLASMAPPAAEQRTMLDGLAGLHAAGVPVDWTGFHAGRGWRKVAMPATPFDRQRLWLDRRPHADSTLPTAAPGATPSPVRAPPGAAPLREVPVIGRVHRAADGDRAAIIEEYLRRMLSTVLGGTAPASFTADEALSRFGLDSLMALALRRELAADFGLDVSLAELVGEATLARLTQSVLARILDAASPADAPAAEAVAEAVAAGDAEDVFPLSHGQRALFFLWQLAPESSAYSLSLPLLLPAPAEAGAWHDACRALVACHPLLRARFCPTEAGVVHRIGPAAGAIDWAETPVAATPVELDAAMAAAHAAPFDLESAPPVRFRWFPSAAGGAVLLVSMHHIVSDGWSLEIIRRQLPGLAAGGTTAPAAPYAEHVRREARMLSGPDGERLWRYWQTQLAAPRPLLDLPTDLGRPAEKAFRGAACGFVLPGDLGERVKALARSTGATSYVGFLTGFLALLHRVSGQDDVIIGSPQAGRERPDTAGTVGYFVDPIVLRSRLDAAASFRDLLARTRQTVLQALEHAGFPFPLLVERLRPERDPGRSPLFDVSFNFIAALPEPDGAAPVLELPQGDGKFDLTLNIRDGATVAGWIGFDCALFHRSSIERLVRRFVTLLGAAVGSPDLPLADLPLADAAAFAPVLAGRRIDIGEEVVVHRRIALQAAAVPDTVAVVAPDAVLTYGALETRAERLGARLRRDGVAQGAVVAVLAERSAAVIVAILAIHHAGAAVALLDPRWPPAMLAQALRSTGIGLAIADPDGRLDQAGVRLLRPEVADGEVADGVHGVGQAGLDDLAYVVFTSGTSGTPKGVGVDQRALANYVADITEALRITPSDRLAVVSTLAADLGFTMVFPALACGACLHILSEPACQDPALFAAYFAAHAIDFLKIVPAHFAALRGPDGTMPRKALVLGGERASPDWVAQLRQVAPACRIVNHYGPTEATIGVLTGALDRADATPHGASLPLRRAVANAEIYLLDSGGAPVAPGAVGEVVIGGPCLARGYLGAAEAAAGGFVTIAGRRMYRTGDLARELGDGGIEILGRCDRQLKLRGLRIEPAHVEAALRRHPGVRDALVVPDADGAAAARLLGFVATAQTPPPTEAELAQFLRGVLPATMIPSRLLAVEAFPRTANGKTDVATLRRRLAGARPADARRLPRDAVELDLAHIWAEVLDLPEVGLDEDFFRLGGHSLLVIQLLARVQARFGRHLSLATVLRHPTIARMAAALRAAPGATGHEVLVPFGSASPNPPLFLLPGAGGSLSYLVPLARRLGARWPCWGLQGLGHLTRDAIPQNVEAIAAAYVARIRAPQPRGPYHLAGHSFGALLAYEMTRQLQDAGEAVAFLGLIDNAAPDDSAIVPERDDAAWLHHIALRIGKLTRTDLRLGELAGRDYRAQVAALMERITASGWLAEGISPAQFERFIEIYKANARAASRYRPPPLAAPAGAVVFRASAEDRELEPADVGRGPALGWDRLLVEAPEILESPGTHLTMFVEPQCAALAEQIDRCLIRVSGRMTASAA